MHGRFIQRHRVNDRLNRLLGHDKTSPGSALPEPKRLDWRLGLFPGKDKRIVLTAISECQYALGGGWVGRQMGPSAAAEPRLVSTTGNQGSPSLAAGREQRRQRPSGQ